MRECRYLCFVAICCSLLKKQGTLGFCPLGRGFLEASFLCLSWLIDVEACSWESCGSQSYQSCFLNTKQTLWYYVLDKRFTSRASAATQRLLWFFFAFLLAELLAGSVKQKLCCHSMVLWSSPSIFSFSPSFFISSFAPLLLLLLLHCANI